ncbi:hypothetical protein BC830DRAFT_210792 [Chytriomyces sp. MP71]|nr:hypothetical protein BC830DRAFT_210792 [Chytriomyces sp. MP71]
MRAAAVRADLDGDADADALVNPVPGIAAVFRITSTILSLAEAVAHDRRRIKRMAARIQKLALTLNTLAHDSHGSALATEGGLYLQASPLDDTASGKSPSKRASVLFGLGTGPGSVSAKNKAVPSHLSTAIPGPPPSVVAWMRHSPSSDSIDSFRSFNSRPTSPVSPTGTPTQGTERSSSRAWRAVSRLSMMALGSPTSPAPLLPGTIQLSSKRPLPPHLTIESLLSLLERIKGFIKNTATTDLVRILGTRQRFETRIKTYQGLLRTWVEECGDGIEDSEAWDLDDALDFVQDAESLKSLLITQLAKLTGDRSFSPLSSTHLMSSSPVPDDDESGAVTDDDDRDFNLLAELRIPSGLHAAAFHFAKRRLEELEARSRQDTELAAVFGSTHSVSEADGSGAAVSGAAGDSTDYSIHPGLEMKWLRLVLKALHACQMDENASSVSPYDLDEEGDGAPLGPVGLGESLKGVFYTRNLQTHTIDSQIVVIKKFRASKRDHSVLLKENVGIPLDTLAYT